MKLIAAILNWIFGRTVNQPVQTEEQTRMLTPSESREREFARLCARLNGRWDGDWEARYADVRRLIRMSMRIEDLKTVNIHAHHGEVREEFWTKWVELSTCIDELRAMSQGQHFYGNDIGIMCVRRWYSIAQTYDQIRDIPYTTDLILTQLVANKRRTLADEALKAAKNCEELILQYNEINNDDRPTSSLQSYAGWSNDESLKPCTIKKLYEASLSLEASLKDLRAEMEEKWRKSSIRAIERVGSAAKFPKLAEEIHPEVTAVLIRKWDSLSMIDVEKAESEEELLKAYSRTRVTSPALELVRVKISRVYEKQIEGSDCTKLLEIGRAADRAGVPTVLIAAIEKYIRLASTEEELRRVWGLTENYPNLRKTLTEKLSSLIK